MESPPPDVQPHRRRAGAGRHGPAGVRGGGQEEPRSARPSGIAARSRVDGPVPAVAMLKIHKAKYGTKVFLNGQVVGEHLPCFTPALMDVKPYLKGDGQPNELVDPRGRRPRVAARRHARPAGILRSISYIPGIYDSVELILTGAPYVVNVQTVPDVPAKTVRVVAEIQAGGEAVRVHAPTCEVSEAASGKHGRAGKSARDASGGRPSRRRST